MAALRCHRIVLYSILIFLAKTLSAADTHIDYYTRFHSISVEDGLPDKHVTVIKEDEMGFIWIGTRNGLVRYDGVTFLTFRHSDDSCSLSDNYVMDIAFDPQGVLWVATHNGLNKYNRKSQCFEKIPLITQTGHGISNSYVRAILPDDRYLWVETIDGILQQLHYSMKDTKLYPHNRIHQEYYDYHTIYQDAKGKIWVGGRGVGPMYLNTETGSFITIKNDPSNPTKKRDKDVAFYYEDSQGQFWTGATDGAYLYNQETGLFKKMLATSTFDVIEGSDHSIWMATGSGLYRYDVLKDQFTKYAHYESDHYSLTDNHVTCVFSDRHGRIWAGTQNGISIWSQGKNTIKHFRHLPHHSASLSDNNVTSFLEDRTGKIWVGTMDGGLNLLSNESDDFERWTQENSELLSNRISALYQDTQGTIWIGHWIGRGFQKYTPSDHTLSSYALSPNTRKSDWYSDFTDYNDSILMTGVWGASGLHLFDKKAETFLSMTWKKPYHPLDGPIHNIETAGDVIWLAAKPNMIHQFDLSDHSFKAFNSDHFEENQPSDPQSTLFPPSFNIIVIFENDGKSYFLTDQGIVVKAGEKFTPITDEPFQAIASPSGSDGVWLGSERGLSYMDEKHQIRKIESPPDQEPIVALGAYDKYRLLVSTRSSIYYYHTQNKEWNTTPAIEAHQARHLTTTKLIKMREEEFVITHTQGFSYYSHDSINYYDFSTSFHKGLSSNVIYDAVNVDSEQRMWLATDRGIFLFDPNVLTFHKLNVLEDVTIYGMDKVANLLYLATEEGLMALDSEENILPYNKPPDDVITSHLTSFVVREHSNPYIWSGTTNKGLNRINLETNQVSHYTSGNGFYGQSAMAFCQTSEGDIFVGGEQLNSFNPSTESFHIPEFATILPDEMILDIMEDQEGNILITTEHHFYRINLTTYHTEDLSNLFEVPNLSFTGSSTKSKDGEVFIGSDKGCFRFYPDQLQIRKPKTQVRVTAVNLVGNRKISTIAYHDRLILEPDENFFIVTFSTMDFEENDTQFAYQLQGVDDDWVETTANDASYTKIGHGNYTFRVKRANEPNSEAYLFDIRIKPPFWFTWWFITVFVLINLILILYWWFLQLSKIRISEKNLDLKQRLLLSQMNPHFLFNTLTTIQGFIYKKEPEVAGNYLSKFARLMRLFLTNMSEDQVSLEKEEDTLNFYLELQRVRHDEHFDYEIVIDCDEPYDMIGLPSMIIQPFVENAVIHGVSDLTYKGFISCFIQLQNDQWKIVIEDNGNGYDPENHGKKYKSRSVQITRDRLASLSKHYKRKFTLTITDLSQTSEEKTGTKIEIYLPVMDIQNT